MSLIPALGRQGEADVCDFENNLVYIVRHSPKINSKKSEQHTRAVSVLGRWRQAEAYWPASPTHWANLRLVRDPVSENRKTQSKVKW